MKKIYIAGRGGMLGEASWRRPKNDFALKCTDLDVNDSWLSFLDLRDHGAEELLSVVNLADTVQLHPVESSSFSQEYFAPRPPCERLVNRKLNPHRLSLIRDWRIALKEYVAAYYQGYLA
jgi:hypothetical protein